MSANRISTTVNDIMSSKDLSNTIFSFLADKQTDKQVHRTRTVNRTFDSAVRQTRKELHIETSDGPFNLCKRWPSVAELFILGMFNDEDSVPFIFPDPEIFATLFPSVKTVTSYNAAINMDSFLPAIGSLSGLTSLDIECDWASNYPDEFKVSTDAHVLALAALVQSAPLNKLSITNSGLSAYDVTPFVTTLASNTSIQHLDLTRSSCLYSDIERVLRTNRTIHTLVFDNIPSHRIETFVDLIAQNTNTTLVTLSVIGLNITAISNAMRTNTTITSLTVGPPGEEDDGKMILSEVTAINDMLAVNTTLTSLFIDGNRTHFQFHDDDDDDHDDEVEVVIDMNAFTTNTTLRSFGLTGFIDGYDLRDVRDKICETIGTGRNLITKLTMADLDFDTIVMLSNHPSLTTLSLPLFNDIEAVEMHEIATVFNSMPNLLTIDLRPCRLSLDDQNELAELVTHPRTVHVWAH